MAEPKYVLILAVKTAAFVLYLVLALVILIKVQFKLDKVSILTITAVLFAFFCRFMSWLVFISLGYGEPNAE
jgi:hypothetical protein